MTCECMRRFAFRISSQFVSPERDRIRYNRAHGEWWLDHWQSNNHRSVSVTTTEPDNSEMSNSGDDELYVNEADEILIEDRLMQCLEQTEQDQVLIEESKQDIGMEQEHLPHGVVIIDGDYWDAIFLSGSQLSGRSHTGILTLEDDNAV